MEELPPDLVLPFLLAILVPITLVPGLVTGCLWATRERWPQRLLLLPVWVCACTTGFVASACLVCLIPALPVVLYFSFIHLGGLFGAGRGGWVPTPEPNPLLGLWMVGTLLVFAVWFVSVWISMMLSGLRGSILARLWVAGTLMLSALLAVSTLPTLVLPIPFVVAAVALLGLLALMSMPDR